MRYLYSFIWYLLSPLFLIYLKKRGIKNKEYNKNWHERFGFNLINKSTKPIIWLHAVSVGETRAIAKIVDLITKEYPSYQLLITNMTPTGRVTSRNLYPKAIRHYIPYDLPHAINNFFNTFKPKVGLIVETEIWPNLIYGAKQHNIPLFLINARLSNKSFNGYNKIKFLIKPILNQFNAILSQDENSQNNFNKLGYIGKHQVIGNIKFDFIPDNNQIELSKKLKSKLNNKKVIIFASTRDGEEEEFIKQIDNKYLYIIVPRHLERFRPVEQILIDNKISYIKRSENKTIGQETQVLLGDSMGEMFMYYAMCDIAVMGGSFANFGSQNLIEPILLNKPVILGTSTYNFKQVTENAITNQCAIQVKDMKECFDKIDWLFNNSYEYNKIQQNCNKFANKYTGASTKVISIIKDYL